MRFFEVSRNGTLMTEMSSDAERVRAFVKKAADEHVHRLPPEPKLADQLRIPRSRLRTLLKVLENEGLIWRHVGKGTFIGPKESGGIAATWSEDISISDIMGARMALEPQLAAEAALHASQADVQTIDRHATAMRTATDFIGWKKNDESFHRAIAEATHNALLLRLYDALRLHGSALIDNRVYSIATSDDEPPMDVDDQHQDIVDAIRKNDPRAAENAMRNHLRHVREQLFGAR
jgi:GntR family transcriptional regulator, transcriptional repressor for pyruvate dehydrogenase complex